MLDICLKDQTIRWAGLGLALLGILGWALPDWILTNVMFGLARGLAACVNILGV